MIERSQQKYHALGSDTVVTIVADSSQVDVANVFGILHDQIVNFELRFSRFLDESELTLFNQHAGQKVAISKEFRDLLIAARDMSKQTEGLYNPFVLPALQKAGYVGSWPSPQRGTKATNFTERHLETIEALVINSSWASIPADSALDFGGIGKGYLLDQLASSLISEKLEGYWLSLGGDIICSGYDLDNQAWAIGIQDAFDVSGVVDTISNKGGHTLAIATSGSIKRRGTHNGESWHHIIDPRTGLPSTTDVLTATVSANSAVAADVYAKSIVIAGANHAVSYKENNVISSYIIQTDGKKTILSKEGK